MCFYIYSVVKLQSDCVINTCVLYRCFVNVLYVYLMVHFYASLKVHHICLGR